MKTLTSRLTNAARLIRQSYAACVVPTSSVLTGLGLLVNTALVPVAFIAVLCGRE